MRQHLRIAFVDYVLEPEKPGSSGLSDVVWDMATQLVDLGHEAHVIATYRTTSYPDERVVVHNFAEPPIGYRNIAGQLWILKRSAEIAKQLDLDVIHTPDYVSTGVLAQLGVKTPLVLTVPGNIFERIQNGHEFEWHYVQLLKWAARKSARECAAVIATSHEMKRWWENSGSSAEKTPLIPYGVATSRFFPLADARQQLGLDKDRPLLLYAGRFAIEKGLFDLIEALAILRDELKTTAAQVMLIGRGSREAELGDKIAHYDLTHWVTIRRWVPQQQLRIWYSAVDALLLPSHSEGFSRSIPEAMACGTPILGSRITGTQDHVHDGKTGYLYNPNQPAELAATIRKALNSPASLDEMRAAALAYVRQNLSWTSIVKMIVDDVYLPCVDAARAQKVAV